VGKTFSGSQRRWGVLLAVGLLLPLLGVRANATDPLKDAVGNPEITLPNLVPNVEDVIIQYFYTDEATQETTWGRPYLYFDTRAQNLGTVPVQLQLTDVPNLQDMASVPVSQCVSWVARVCRKQEPVGGFVWHQAHGHWHYQEFAKYELRRVGADGRPDYSSTGLVGVSEKVSFCFVDSDYLGNDDVKPLGYYRACTPTVQGISPGWTDIYDRGLPGQQFSLHGLSDGRYAVIIDMDYANRLRETNDDDNYVEVTVDISGDLTNASIVSRNYPAPNDRGTTTTSTLGKKPKKNA
jgi:lysyl oxidase